MSNRLDPSVKAGVLRVMETYKTPSGGVDWGRAKQKSPELVRELMTGRSMQQLYGITNRLRRSQKRRAIRRAPAAVPAALAPTITKLPNFCPHCGHNIRMLIAAYSVAAKHSNGAGL